MNSYPVEASADSARESDANELVELGSMTVDTKGPNNFFSYDGLGGFWA